MSVIGEADIIVGADANPFERALDSATRSITNTVTGNLAKIADATPKELGKMVTQVGNSMQSVGDKLTKGITLPIGGATLAAGGLVSALGWKRLASIDTAQAQLKGLGYTAEDVDRITENLTVATTGGMLTMAEATFAAAGAMAAGVQEGDELTRYIKLLDSAIVGGTGSFDEMNQIFGRVMDTGKLTRNEFDMMAQRMPGFSNAVQKSMGVSSEAMYEMLSAGEITSEQFLQVIDDFAAGMASEYAKTWDGMVQNTWAYVGILGQALMGGVFEQSKESIAELIELLSSEAAAEWAASAGEKIGAAFTKIVEWIKQAIVWWTELSPAAQKAIGVLAGIAVVAGPVISVLGRIVGAIGGLIGRFPALGTAISGMAAMFSRGLTGAAGASFTFAGRMGLAVQQGGGLLKFFGKFAGIAGLVITALVSMWQESESFREGIKSLAGAVFDLIGSVVSSLMPIFEALVPLFDAAGGVVATLGGALGDILGVALQLITPLIEILADLLSGALGAALELLVPIITWVAELLGTVLVVAAEAIATAISWVVDKFSEGGDGASALGGVWEWLSGVFEAVATAFQVAGDWIASVWEAIKVAAEPVVDWFSTHVGPVFEALGELMGAIFDRVASLVVPAFEKIRDGLSLLVEGFRIGWAQIGEWWATIWEAVGAVWEATGAPVFEAIGLGWETMLIGLQAVWDTIGPPLIAAIESAWTTVQIVFETIWNVIKTIFGAVWDSIKLVVETALAAIAGVIRAITEGIKGNWQGFWLEIFGVAQTIWNGITGVVDIAITAILGVVVAVMNGIRAAWTTVWTGISTFVTAIWNGIKSAVNAGINFVRTIIVNVVNAIRSVWNSVWSGISSFFSSIWSSIRNAASNFTSGVRNTVGSLMDFVRSIPSRILGVFSNIGSWLLASGRSLIQGFINGITAAFENAKSAVSNGLSKIRDLFPFSPAKEGPFSGRGWVSYAGESVGETFAGSISDALSRGEGTVADAMGGIADTFGSLSAPAFDTFSVGVSMAEQLASGLLAGQSQVTQAAEALAAAAGGDFNALYGPSVTGPGIVRSADQLSTRRGFGGGTPPPAPAAPEDGRVVNIYVTSNNPDEVAMVVGEHLR